MLQNPLFIYPTLKATRRAIGICNSLFGKEHHGNGKSNAVRHALWSILICQNIFKMIKNEEKSIHWTQKVTDLHEKLAPNAPLETTMDLHNNEVGRKYFNTVKYYSEEEIILFLEEKVLKAKEVSDTNTMLNHKNDLVYLTGE